MDINKIKIKYKVNKEKKIRLFGKIFVEENKNKCKIKINKIKNELKEYYEIEDTSNIEEINIYLIGIKNIKNMNSMFEECESLLSLTNISKLNTSNITDMNRMFKGCKLLLS